MDKNGRIKGKVSIIDILVVILVLAVIAGIAARYSSSVTKSVKSDVKFEYVLKVENVRDYTAVALEKKGKLTDKKSERDMGEIVSVERKDAFQQSTTASGEVSMTKLPDRYTCYVTIQAVGKESDNNYILADSTELSVGRNIDLYTKYAKTSGTITSVKVIE